MVGFRSESVVGFPRNRWSAWIGTGGRNPPEYAQQALELYHRIPEPYSIGQTHRRLARTASDEAERSRHLDAAREAWRSIDPPDPVAELDD